MLDNGEMPPKKSKQLSESERKELRGWVERYLDAEARANAGDPEHAGVVESLLVIATGVIWLAFMIELGFRPGTPGENQYGPDPLGRA